MIESTRKLASLSATNLGPWEFPIGSLKSRVMARALLQGIGEEVSGFCICFPEDEQPFFFSDIEEKIADRLKCNQHGDRFHKPYFHVYVAAWLKEKRSQLISRHSPQYQKAWFAAFPPDLWPAEEVLVDNKRTLRLKDGTLVDVAELEGQ
jgi:hypothetical protein